MGDDRDRRDSKHKSRDRDREDRHRSSRDDRANCVQRLVQDRDRDKERRKDKDRERDRDRRDRDRDRGKGRSRSRSRERRDKRSPSAAEREDREDRKRSRREDSAPAPAAAAVATNEVEAARQKALSAEEERKRAREAEQAELDEEMEKRRKRIEAWQEQRRKQAAQQAAQAAQPPKKKKAWTLEDESDEDEDEGPAPQAAGGDVAMADAAEGPSRPPPKAGGDEDEEEDPLDAFMRQNVKGAGGAAAAAGDAAAGAAGSAEGQEEELDPLDAFMQANVLPEVQQPKAEAAGAAAEDGAAAKPGDGAGAAAAAEPSVGTAANGEVSSRPTSITVRRRGRPLSRYGSDSSDDEYESSEEEKEEESEDDEEWMRKVQAGKLTKGDKLVPVDHAAIDYAPFRRNFYIEVPELARMTAKEVEEYRAELDGIKVRGKNVPKPIKNWHQCGLSGRILEVLRKGGFERPLPIQAQALPVIMSGRDCIGIAKTGSGKTLGFVLPMLRHVKDQPPLAQGDGPVALCMAPTRELVTQIGKEIKRFAKAVSLACVCVFGGSGVANQITELKRGTEIVVCTPGRMIDLLVTSGGKITNLRRVTYLVMDEADRMFDMGFEPQIMRIVNNIRPDRQTVMFSATFPRSVEMLARKVLVDPVEIQVGGRSVVNKDITQYVEIRPEEERFLRLLEVLGEWYERGKILIFVSSQERCDNLFRDLLKAGYPCLSLHGGKDQSDRQSTIADYKSGVGNILVATSVAARGLDVRDLVLVVNYDVPNHHEDYVHRVGRTGRAGNKGTAITFIAPDEEQYSPDLVKALSESSAPIPQDLKEMCERFEKKRKEGLVRAHGSGYGGTGFKFDATEDAAQKAIKKAMIKEHGMVEESESESEDEIRLVRKEDRPPEAQQPQQGQPGQPGQPGPMPEAPMGPIDLSALPAEVRERIKAAQELAQKLQASGTVPSNTAAGIPGLPGSAAPGMPGAAGQAPEAAPQLQPPQPEAAAPAPAAINPMVAAAQAVAQRLAAQAGVSVEPPPAGQPDAQAAAAAQLPPGLLALQAKAAQMQLPQGLAALQAQAAAQQQPPGVAAQAQLPPGLLALQAQAAQLQAQAAAAGQPAGAAGQQQQLPAALQALQAAAAQLPPGLLAAQAAAAGLQGKEPDHHFETELEINDFPQHARWKITHRDTINAIGDMGAAMYIKGRYYKPGERIPPTGERKLYLLIQGPTENVVRRAKQEVKAILEEYTEKAMRREGPSTGRYSIV